MSDTMTRGEREDLQRLVRQREKVQKSAAKERSAQMLADFESQMGAIYRSSDDPIWSEVVSAATREIEKAQKQIAARCHELGIPKQFAPSLRADWQHRGWDNSVEKRRNELRTIAKRQIEALERRAMVEIETASVEAQTQLAVAGLTSAAALAFVEKLPTIESLMPALSFQELAQTADPPIVEQLISPNAIRQRRFRERQAALHNAPSNAAEALHNGPVSALPNGGAHALE
jgi:hypothetical protein